METPTIYERVAANDEAGLETLYRQANSLIDPGFKPISNMANMASFLYWSLETINWIGFYFAEGTTLHLGPFHGKPACVVIDFEKGVCGAAARNRATIVVPDVARFPGHIVCDPASRSEIVVPILHGNTLVGVLDVDSPVPERFGTAEQAFFERCVAALTETFPEYITLLG